MKVKPSDGAEAAFAELDLENRYGVRDCNLFYVSLDKPRLSLNLEDAYATLEEKAAALAIAVVRNHPFIDANKRTGILAGMVMLRANGRAPIANPVTLYEVAISIENKTMDQERLTEWMSDWNNVLPVMEEEWEENPQLFDPSPWVAGSDEEE